MTTAQDLKRIETRWRNMRILFGKEVKKRSCKMKFDRCPWHYGSIDDITLLTWHTVFQGCAGVPQGRVKR